MPETKIPLTVAITGSSGLVGKQLCRVLAAAGHKVIVLQRSAGAVEQDDVVVDGVVVDGVVVDGVVVDGVACNAIAATRLWHPEAPAANLLAGVDAVVHLAGAPIARRFTARQRRAIHDSRIVPTQKLAELVAVTPGCDTLVTASAVGYYGYQTAQPVTEASPQGRGFLAAVCAGWEQAAQPARAAGKRVVQIRTGLVLSAAGGILKILALLTRAGVNGPLAGGKQWFAWIGAMDLLQIYRAAIENPAYQGPVNAVGPQPVTNREFTAVLARLLHRPAVLPVPRLVAVLLFGKIGARELALASQNVRPQRLIELGYEFQQPTVAAAIKAELGL